MVVKITEAKNGIEMSVSKLGQKGYIAKITGPDYKYKMARFFLPKEKTQTIECGLYEIREGAAGKKQYYNVEPAMFNIPGQPTFSVTEVTYNEAITIAENTKEERRGINVRGGGESQFYERKSYKSSNHIRNDYPDKQIPGNPPVRWDL